jgi:hypothetical protein
VRVVTSKLRVERVREMTLGAQNSKASFQARRFAYAGTSHGSKWPLRPAEAGDVPSRSARGRETSARPSLLNGIVRLKPDLR